MMNRQIYTLLVWMLTYGMGFGQLTVVVDQIPANTPPSDPIHIAGDFQGWDAGSADHILSEDTTLNVHLITLPSGLGTIEFKFTRGSWAKVESDENGNFIPNRQYTGSEGDTITLQILGWEDIQASCLGELNETGESTAAENVEVLTDTFFMPQFNRCRRIWIYLPPDYHLSNKTYPVLYMHDGQNVFDERTAFIGEWQVDETLNQLYAEGDSGVIVVAIDNGGLFRTEEYTPWPNPNFGGGKGALYVDFIVQTLKPVIDSTFRTRPDRENTGIMGSSFGGLISTYAGIEHQDVFSKVGTFSPSYWVSTQTYSHVETTGKEENMKIYQLMGAKEGMTAVNDMYKMEEVLHSVGFEEDEVISVEKADGEHTESFWAREFAAAYLWLFRDVATSNDPTLSSGHEFSIYPNPITEHMTVSFYVSKAAPVRIDFFDLKGQLIHSAYSKTLLEGHHKIKLDMTQLAIAAGNYVCRLMIDGQSASRTISIAN